MSIRHMKRAVALSVATMGLGAAAFTASAAPASAASAAPAAPDAEVAPLALAPPCVDVNTRTGFLTKYEDVRNLCGRTHRVKVIVAWGPDSPCHRLDDGEGFTHTHGIAGRFDRLELC